MLHHLYQYATQHDPATGAVKVSSKFNSTTMRNKTPPVCQKHQPSPTLPDPTVWPGIIAAVTVYGPLPVPNGIWTQQVKLKPTATPNEFKGQATDEFGSIWRVTWTHDGSFNEWTASVTVDGATTFAAGTQTTPVASMSTYPLDTGLALAESVFRADNVRWRFTV